MYIIYMYMHIQKVRIHINTCTYISVNAFEGQLLQCSHPPAELRHTYI